MVISAIVLSGCMTAYLAFFAAKRRKSAGALAFSGLMASTTIYSWAYAFELTRTTVTGIKLCLMVEYIGISALPAFLIIHSFRYTGKDKWLRPSLYGVLLLFSGCTLVLNITNDFHHLFYRAISFSVIQGLSITQLQKGPWYWVHIVYLNVGILSVNILFLEMLIRAQYHYRKQAAAMLLGTLIPWISLITYLGGYTPYGIDPLPIAFGLMGPVFGLGMFRFRLLDIVPIARHFVFESMRDPVLVLDNQNRIADYNQAAKEVFSVFPKSIIGEPVEDALGDFNKLINTIHSGSDEQIEIMDNDKNNPRYFQTTISTIFTHGKLPVGRVLTFLDISQQTLLRKKLENLAITDELTGLINRRYFTEAGENEISQAERHARPISLLMMDIDHFKTVNDTWGHAAGDLILQEVTAACASSLRGSDLFARWGGEEFTLLLPETDHKHAMLIAERLREKIAALKIAWEDTTITVTASFGVNSIIKTEGVSLDEMIQKADRALYRAKAGGRNRVAYM
ncbi:MAG TPA: diguanylate cyclase [Spirochaetota bacterium]|nr:diguanylate cyclase [Spirochaetota bacterium]